MTLERCLTGAYGVGGKNGFGVWIGLCGQEKYIGTVQIFKLR